MKLPTIQPQPASAKRTGQIAARSQFVDSAWHSLRVVLLLILILSLHRLSVSRRAIENAQPIDHPQLLAVVQKDLPRASSFRPLDADGLLEILDAQGARIGALAATSPRADSVVGYSGPNNVLLIVDSNQTVVACRLLSSGDTQDHVALVVDDAHFWQQFVGRTWGSGADASAKSQSRQVDGVSGATLTSLAIVEAIELRMSGQRLNLRFPNSPTLAEAISLAPETTELVACTWHGRQAWQPRNKNGKVLGTIVRTGNLIDSVEGYQGPTELLLWFDTEEVLRSAKLRGSYDNQPYVGYVQQEYSFWSLFKQRSLTSLAAIDLEADRIEGVSGATMTSIAVAQTIQKAAERLLQESSKEASSATALRVDVRATRKWNWSLTEIATAAIALASIPWSRWHLRGRRLPRLLWQATCLLVLGIAAGNLLSIALFAGWIRGGVPLHLAPGLVTLLAVGLVWPVATKSNVYCDHLCPHGIVQQWLRPKGWRALTRFQSKDSTSGPGSRAPLSRWLAIGLKWTSYAGVGAAFGWVAFGWPIELSAMEPFDAYAWRVGWSVSCLMWIVSIMVAIWRPMSYCQLACPTGRLLDVLRRSRRMRTSWWVEGVLMAAIASVWLASI